MTATKRKSKRARSVAAELLPKTLTELPLASLRLPDDLAERLAADDLLTLGDLLELPKRALTKSGELPPEAQAAVRDAVARALDDGLRQFAGAAANDWKTVRAQLIGPLDDEARALFQAAVGVDQQPRTRPALQQIAGKAPLDESLARLRATLSQRCPGIVARLQTELEAEFLAFDGVLHAQHAAEGSLVRALAGVDRDLGLRLAAFCLPHLCHLHRGVLHAVAPRRFRELLRTLPPLVPQHRLPLPVDAIDAQLRQPDVAVPRGVLLHVLRTELRTAIEVDGDHGEVAVPDPRGPAAKLVELMTELGAPAKLEDLVFAYRERFRFASRQRILNHLTDNSAFVRVGAETWSLRQRHEEDLAAVAPLAEQTARRISGEGGRHRVADLLRGEDGAAADERTVWLVIDRLADDPRVRLLGRGEACPGSLQQSAVMQRLTRAFRRAAGEVVKSRFVTNQPIAQRRLVERLLEQNRNFVQVAPDRIDSLTNYPFNQERMQRLSKLVQDHLRERVGYAHAEALKDAVDRTDLGGKWLSPELLADILRRNGPFDVLPSGIVALADIGLVSTLRRLARQALRELDEAVTVRDVVRARPELAEFTDCLAEILSRDPLVLSPDGAYFKLV